MKIFSISSASNFISRPMISSFHAAMFHGIAERDSKAIPHDTPVYANTKLFSALEVSRSGRNVPKISQPGRNLVVNDEVARDLQGILNIRIAPVIMKKVVDIQWSKGVDPQRQWQSADPESLILSLPESKSLAEQIGNFYEIHSFRYRDIAKEFDQLEIVSMQWGTPPLVESVEFALSVEMVNEYPILGCGEIVLHESVFHILERWLDQDFFCIRDYILK